MPKLDRYKKNEDTQETLRNITDEKARDNIRSTAEAIDGYAMLGCIALGMLQMISKLALSRMFAWGNYLFKRFLQGIEIKTQAYGLQRTASLHYCLRIIVN